MRRAAVALSILVLACVAAPMETPEDVVVYLVRHAERAEDGTDDPPISEAGQERARLVATLLGDAGITHIHSTDYRRTHQTAQPAVDATGLEVLSYDPRDLEGFAQRLRETPGRHLVVGHSNTTPELVAALGGDPRGPIDEFEYDRLYIVVAGADHVSTVLLRFGQPFEEMAP